jgi:hypothetical protein
MNSVTTTKSINILGECRVALLNFFSRVKCNPIEILDNLAMIPKGFEHEDEFFSNEKIKLSHRQKQYICHAVVRIIQNYSFMCHTPYMSKDYYDAIADESIRDAKINYRFEVDISKIPRYNETIYATDKVKTFSASRRLRMKLDDTATYTERIFPCPQAWDDNINDMMKRCDEEGVWTDRFARIDYDNQFKIWCEDMVESLSDATTKGTMVIIQEGLKQNPLIASFNIQRINSLMDTITGIKPPDEMSEKLSARDYRRALGSSLAFAMHSYAKDESYAELIRFAKDYSEPLRSRIIADQNAWGAQYAKIMLLISKQVDTWLQERFIMRMTSVVEEFEKEYLDSIKPTYKSVLSGQKDISMKISNELDELKEKFNNLVNMENEIKRVKKRPEYLIRAEEKENQTKFRQKRREYDKLIRAMKEEMPLTIEAIFTDPGSSVIVSQNPKDDTYFKMLEKKSEEFNKKHKEYLETLKNHRVTTRHTIKKNDYSVTQNVNNMLMGFEGMQELVKKYHEKVKVILSTDVLKFAFDNAVEGKKLTRYLTPGGQRLKRWQWQALVNLVADVIGEKAVYKLTGKAMSLWVKVKYGDITPADVVKAHMRVNDHNQPPAVKHNTKDKIQSLKLPVPLSRRFINIVDLLVNRAKISNNSKSFKSKFYDKDMKLMSKNERLWGRLPDISPAERPKLFYEEMLESSLSKIFRVKFEFD